MKIALRPLSAVLLAATLSACASHMAAPDVPAAIAVPGGKAPAMTLKGVGNITYECRAKADAAGGHAWVFGAPDAMLQTAMGRTVGKYYGGPTWEHNDGSKVTGKQLAVSPAGGGNIPLQLVQTAPATGAGAFAGTTYIQRVNTVGGVAPSSPCTAGNAGAKQKVDYSADYVFYK